MQGVRNNPEDRLREQAKLAFFMNLTFTGTVLKKISPTNLKEQRMDYETFRSELKASEVMDWWPNDSRWESLVAEDLDEFSNLGLAQLTVLLNFPINFSRFGKRMI